MPFDGSLRSIQKDFFTNLSENILPYYYQNALTSHFLSRDGKRIHYVKFTNPENDKILLISPGRTEPGIKYAEWIFDLKDKGYDICIVDHRGQGFSERLLQDPHKGYVNKFKDYVDDFQSFADISIAEKSYRKRILFAHSMGSVIGLRFAQRAPDFFDGIILSSPMFEIKLKGLTEKFALRVFHGLHKMGLSKRYALNGGPRNNEVEFEDNRMTSCPMRYHMSRHIEEIYPELVMGDVTYQWVHQAIIESRRAYRERRKINVPVLMFQAGQDDLVKKNRQDKFFRHIDNYKKVFYADAFHEILMEKESIRSNALKEVELFLKAF